MQNLTPVEWTVVGPIIVKRAAMLATLTNPGSDVNELGFLTNTVNEVMGALNAHRAEEDEAWNAHAARKNSAALVNDPSDWV